MDRERTDLEHRWNVAMSDAGFAGSEYIDEPETVAERIKDVKNKKNIAIRKVGQLTRELNELREAKE